MIIFCLIKHCKASRSGKKDAFSKFGHTTPLVANLAVSGEVEKTRGPSKIDKSQK
jgi:hypothetical protein